MRSHQADVRNLRGAADDFAGTPVGDVFRSARDLAGDLRRQTRSGSKFIAMLNACPWDDGGWDGDSDPLGYIKCGEDYTIHFDSGSSSWIATGIPDSNGAGSSIVAITANTLELASSPANSFGIWGAIFKFDEKAGIFAEDGTRIGAIRPLTPEEIVIDEKRQAEASASKEFESQLRKAGNVKVVLDSCPVDDDGWQGDSDPFGTIKCGETYSLRYLPNSDMWQATGFNEASDAVITAEAAAAPIGKGVVVIWGAEFKVDADQRVLSGSDTIGRLE
ncbi:MAG: hypothetical protein EOP84_33965, partial [Verrucomicrobiaceae bacterium]